MLTTTTETRPVWLAGASGLLAGEFARLLEMHPNFHLAGVISRGAGSELTGLHPHLSGSLSTCSLEDAAVALAKTEGEVALVIGLPHGESAAFWKDLRGRLGKDAERLLVVDLSADYRLSDPAVYAQWYGKEQADLGELKHFIYGLPELNREAIANSRRVASPGCFATALQLACLPAARAGLLDTTRPWVLNAITGSSGSGVRPGAGTHHPHRNGNLHAYGLGGHRHEAELEQGIAAVQSSAGLPQETPPICFVPHSGPYVRGIHLTAVLPLKEAATTEEVAALYGESYCADPFVEVLTSSAPDVRRVAGSNRVSLQAIVKGEQLVCLLTLDNVVKGGAGQALQCLNLMSGFEETAGLPVSGLGVL